MVVQKTKYRHKSIPAEQETHVAFFFFVATYLGYPLFRPAKKLLIAIWMNTVSPDHPV